MTTSKVMGRIGDSTPPQKLKRPTIYCCIKGQVSAVDLGTRWNETARANLRYFFEKGVGISRNLLKEFRSLDSGWRQILSLVDLTRYDFASKKEEGITKYFNALLDQYDADRRAGVYIDIIFEKLKPNNPLHADLYKQGIRYTLRQSDYGCIIDL